MMRAIEIAPVERFRWASTCVDVEQLARAGGRAALACEGRIYSLRLAMIVQFDAGD